MEYAGFIAETYPARSYAVSIDRLVNWYPEIVESKKGKSIINYYPTTGLVLVSDATNLISGGSAGRGMFSLDGRNWAVIGASLVEFNASGALASYGPLAVDGWPVSMAANSATPTQLMIAAGGRGYIFDTGAHTLTEIPISDTFFGARQVAFLDGYFIALTPDSRQIQISDSTDGASWSALDFSINTASADKVQAIITDHEYLYLMGTKRSAVYANTGDVTFPITAIPGAFIEHGIRAPFSVKRVDNTLMWYGENEYGKGSVYRAEGFIPKRVSTNAIEAVWSQYTRDDDAVAFVAQRDSHIFYRITFPLHDQTWVYDLTTDMWHERGAWDVANNIFHAQTQRFHCYSTDSNHYVCGSDGKIYREETNVYTEDGRPIKRVRIAPMIAAQNKLMFVTRLEVVIQPGIGIPAAPNPLMTLRYSPDAGATWSSPMTAAAGAAGATDTRVVFDQLGSGRSWVPEISVIDPVNWVLISAQVEAAMGAW